MVNGQRRRLSCFTEVATEEVPSQ